MTDKQRGKKARRRWRSVVYHRDDFTCQYCGEKKPEDELSIDEFWPSFFGGNSTPENWVTACRICNALKDKLPPLFFRRHRKELQDAYEIEGKLFERLRHEKPL
jgi:5-methylcytosine-specific restriction endonuclease McrA